MREGSNPSPCGVALALSLWHRALALSFEDQRERDLAVDSPFLLIIICEDERESAPVVCSERKAAASSPLRYIRGLSASLSSRIYISTSTSEISCDCVWERLESNVCKRTALVYNPVCGSTYTRLRGFLHTCSIHVVS